jgi:putative proteasome-type protease
VTYCVGIMTREGLVMASDSRTNAGYDQVNICRKMHTFVTPGEHAFIVMTSGSLSLSQSVVTLLRNDFERGMGLKTAPTLYDAARVIGDKVRFVSELDRAALERDDFRFNVNLLFGGQIGNQKHELFLIYPQGNPLAATEDSPYLQIGECKYGRPILDRGVVYHKTTLAEAAKYAVLSIDSTMRSNVTVGPPIDLIVYYSGELDITHQTRFLDKDPELIAIHTQWEQTLRKGVQELPDIRFKTRPF